MIVPKIADSDREERLAFIQEKYKCRVDCDLCGNCKVLRGRDAELVPKITIIISHRPKRTCFKKSEMH